MRSNAPRGLDRKKIRALYKDGFCVEEIARRFKCRSNAIMHHIYDLVIPCKAQIRNNARLTENQVNVIRKLFIHSKKSVPYLSQKYKVSQSTILNVVHGVFYRWVPGEVIDGNGLVHLLLEGFYTNKRINTKGAKKGGPNSKTVRMVPSGALIPIAKRYKVSTCTISRWIRKGKINIKGVRHNENASKIP